jgi:hypothetical protein
MTTAIQVCGIGAEDRVPLTRNQLEGVLRAVVRALSHEPARDTDITTSTIRVMLDDGEVVVDVTDFTVYFRQPLVHGEG